MQKCPLHGNGFGQLQGTDWHIPEDFLHTWVFLGLLVYAHLEWFAVSIAMRPQSCFWQLMGLTLCRRQEWEQTRQGRFIRCPCEQCKEWNVAGWTLASTNFMVSPELPVTLQGTLSYWNTDWLTFPIAADGFFEAVFSVSWSVFLFRLTH